MNYPASFSRPGASHQRAAFTLIELLFVCGIIALIVSLAMVSFHHINRGANLKAAERQVLGGTFLARQHSVNTRQKVLFAIPYKTYGNGAKYVRTNMLYRSFMYMAQETKGVARPDSILGKIETLPPGVVFDKNSIQSLPISITLISTNNNMPMFEARGFRYAPHGAIHWADVNNSGGAKEYTIVLKEGTIDKKGDTQLKPKGGSSTAEVNIASGRCSFKGKGNQY